MKVQLIAATALTPEINKINDQYRANLDYSDAEILIEAAGRSCYQSWNKPNPDTARPDGYVRNILKQEHYSVLEHATVTFYITGISRSLTHELIRHRHFSFSQQSQRFVDETNAEMIIPPAIAMNWDTQTSEGITLGALWLYTTDTTTNTYNTITETLTQQGLPRKQAREAARSILPNATETRITITGNHRTWREFILKRTTPHADQEIQALATQLLHQLHTNYPSIYQDLHP